MIEVLLLILIGLIALGWVQAKKMDAINLDNSNFTGNQFERMKIQDVTRFPDAVYYKSAGMTPKQYGETYGTGADRHKKSNRLKCRR